MLLINRDRWVIETNIPEQASKRIYNEKEGRDEIVPDGPRKDVWHWFMGARSQQIMPGVIGHFPVATPYTDQAVRYESKDDALWVLANILPKDAGWQVVSEKKSHLDMGLKVIIPIQANEDFIIDAKQGNV